MYRKNKRSFTTNIHLQTGDLVTSKPFDIIAIYVSLGSYISQNTWKECNHAESTSYSFDYEFSQWIKFAFFKFGT